MCTHQRFYHFTLDAFNFYKNVNSLLALANASVVKFECLKLSSNMQVAKLVCYYLVMVWHCGSIIGHVITVALCWAWLVLGWLTWPSVYY